MKNAMDYKHPQGCEVERELHKPTCWKWPCLIKKKRLPGGRRQRGGLLEQNYADQLKHKDVLLSKKGFPQEAWVCLYRQKHTWILQQHTGDPKEQKLLFVEEVEWTLMLDGNSLGPVKNIKQEDNASGKFWVPSVWIGEWNTFKKLS